MRTLRAAVACIFLFAPTTAGTLGGGRDVQRQRQGRPKARRLSQVAHGTVRESVNINSICPLPRWDNATMDTLARREGYKINDTDITAVPWSTGNLDVPTVKCEQRAKGTTRRRVVVVLVDAIHRPLFETKYPLSMKFGQQDHTVLRFKHHHTHGYNSLPNQKALYAGISQATTSADAPKWLHKTFKESGYTTIHADDACEPTETYGSLTNLMGAKPGDVMPDDRALCNVRCTDPDPSCLGPSSLEFVAQAVEQHAHCDLFVTVNPQHEHSIRWWYSNADLWVLRFLQRVVDQHTIAVITSDHGLHYGAPSITPIGAAYRTNPLLLILLPKRMRGAKSKALQRSTSASLTTHLNTYAFLHAIASGTTHGKASLASPNFELNQTCKEALIPSTECRRILAGSCTSATEQRARTLLHHKLRAVSANPHCTPLDRTSFSITSCTGVETAHVASFRRGHRSYQLKWDSEQANLTTLVQQTAWAKDVDPCRSVIPRSLRPLCICSANSTDGVQARKAEVERLQAEVEARRLRAEVEVERLRAELEPERSERQTAPEEAKQQVARQEAVAAAPQARKPTLTVVGAAVLLLCIGCGLATSAGRARCDPLSGAFNGSLKGATLLAVGVSVLFVCMETLQSIMVQFSKVNGRGVEYHMSSAVFYTEFLKLIISIALWMAMPPTSTSRPPTDGDGKLWSCDYCPPSSATISRVAGVMAYALPAALYVAQNNLTIRAMGLLDPPTYQLWVTFRLLPSAFLTRFALKRHISLVQWIALILLMLCMGVTTLKQGRCVDVSTSSADGEWRGIALVVLNGCLSATSGVINEWLLKYQDASLPMTLKNARVYAAGALLAIPTMRLPWTPGALHGFSPSAWAVVCTNAALGLSVSLVLRYADNLVKNFTSAAAVILSALVSAPLFGFQWTYPFVIGALIICCSFLLYFCVGARAAAEGRTVQQQNEA